MNSRARKFYMQAPNHNLPQSKFSSILYLMDSKTSLKNRLLSLSPIKLIIIWLLSIIILYLFIEFSSHYLQKGTYFGKFIPTPSPGPTDNSADYPLPSSPIPF